MNKFFFSILFLAICTNSLTPPGAPKNFEIVVVDFQAPWCIDCKILSYQMPRVIKKHSDVLFLIVDVDRVRSARKDFNIRHIPHVSFFYKNLTELASIVEGNGPQVDSKITELKEKIQI